MRKKDRRDLRLEKIYEYAADIVSSDCLKQEERIRQHGSNNCYDHSLAVAVTSVGLAESLNLDLDMESMIKGALLHDYYLYDWRSGDVSRWQHGRTHARCSLENACRDFELTPISRDVIEKHMFPLTGEVPRYKESVVVNVADKICAFREVCSHVKIKVRRRTGRHSMAPIS